MDTSHLTLYKKNAEIQERIQELADDINKNYKDEEVMIVGLFIGAFRFFNDLAVKIKLKVKFDCVFVSSYVNNKMTDTCTVTKDLKYDAKDMHVIIIDDIIDSGRSMNTVIELIESKQAKSVRPVTLVGHKDTKYPKINNSIEYFWEYTDNLYFVGYGFDDKEYMRQLNDIYFMKK